MAEAIEEVENDLAALMTQIDELTKKIVKIEVQFKRNDKYIPLYEWKKPRDNRGKRVEEMLSVILHKVSEHEGVFDEMKKNIEVMKQMINLLPDLSICSRNLWVMHCLISTHNKVRDS